jgi:hypothetical protein
MDTEQSAKIRRYMLLKTLEKKSDLELEELRPQVLGFLMDYDGVDAKVQSSLGKLSIQTRDTWVFPENIVKAEAELKEMKKQAKQDGTATATQSHNLLFKEASGENGDEKQPLEV